MHAPAVWDEHVMYTSVCMWGGMADEPGWKWQHLREDIESFCKLYPQFNHLQSNGWPLGEMACLTFKRFALKIFQKW